jgi:hypothetical protein
MWHRGRTCNGRCTRRETSSDFYAGTNHDDDHDQLSGHRARDNHDGRADNHDDDAEAGGTSARTGAREAVASVAAPPSTTTTTQSPKTPLEVALKYLGQTGPWADGGFYCAKAVSYFAEEAQVEGFVARDGPSPLYADAVADGRFTETPAVGDMIFIDLFGPGGIGHGQVTHVGIVETVEGLTEGSTIAIVQGNGAPDPSVITRTTYHLGDGYIVGFAPFA